MLNKRIFMALGAAALVVTPIAIALKMVKANKEYVGDLLDQIDRYEEATQALDETIESLKEDVSTLSTENYELSSELREWTDSFPSSAPDTREGGTNTNSGGVQGHYSTDEVEEIVTTPLEQHSYALDESDDGNRGEEVWKKQPTTEPEEHSVNVFDDVAIDYDPDKDPLGISQDKVFKRGEQVIMMYKPESKEAWDSYVNMICAPFKLLSVDRLVQEYEAHEGYFNHALPNFNAPTNRTYDQVKGLFDIKLSDFVSTDNGGPVWIYRQTSILSDILYQRNLFFYGGNKDNTKYTVKDFSEITIGEILVFVASKVGSELDVFPYLILHDILVNMQILDNETDEVNVTLDEMSRAFGMMLNNIFLVENETKDDVFGMLGLFVFEWNSKMNDNIETSDLYDQINFFIETALDSEDNE